MNRRHFIAASISAFCAQMLSAPCEKTQILREFEVWRRRFETLLGTTPRWKFTKRVISTADFGAQTWFGLLFTNGAGATLRIAVPGPIEDRQEWYRRLAQRCVEIRKGAMPMGCLLLENWRIRLRDA